MSDDAFVSEVNGSCGPMVNECSREREMLAEVLVHTRIIFT